MSGPAPATDPARRARRRGRTGPAGLQGVRLGVPVTVRVPATSANLGPGFDCLGLAVGVHDVVTVEAFTPGAGEPAVLVRVTGEGVGAVPDDERHRVVASVRAGLAHAGAGRPGLRVTCANGVPHGRGLGSSAAAVVAGLVAARGLLAPELAPALDDDALLALASAAEGHPDNAAAALHGGLVLSWCDAPHGHPAGAAPGGPVGGGQAGGPVGGPVGGLAGGLVGGGPRAVRLAVDACIVPVVCVPQERLATSHARGMLPATVPHADAAFTGARTALLVEALARRPDLLFAATEDRLHQAQRAPAMPASAALVAGLRATGAAAVVSGAGPSVLVLCASADEAAQVAASARLLAGHGWRVLTPDVDGTGAALAPPGPVTIS